MMKMKKMSALLLAAAMGVMSAVPVWAGTYTELDGSTTGAEGNGIVPLVEKMTLERGDTAKPEVTYTFAVQETENPNISSYGASGGATGVPVIKANAEVRYGKNTDYSDGTGESYSRVSDRTNVEFDMSAVRFKLPGVYYWTITKTASDFGSNQGNVSNNNLAATNMTAAEAQTFYLYAIVTNSVQADTQLQVTYGFYETSNVTDGETAKDDTIIDQYPGTKRDLTLEKTVSGNQGDKTKAFAFTIRLQGAGNERYNLEYEGQSDADTFNGEMPATISFQAPVTVYLKHGQKVTIKDLPEGVSYTITESGVSSGTNTDGYRVSATVANDTEGVSNQAATDGTVSDPSLGKDGAVVTFTNTKDTVTPTGLLLQFGPPAAVLLIALLGLVSVMISRRRRTAFAE